MNILYICNEYPPGKNGGIGSATRILAERMALNGHKVFIAGLYYPGYGQPDYEENGPIKIWRKRLSIDKGWIWNDYSAFDTLVLSLLKTTGLLFRSYQKGIAKFLSFLYQLVIDHKIDIIEWPDYNECFEYGCPIDLPSGFPAPIVVKLHGSISYIKQQTNRTFDPFAYQIEKKHVSSASALIAVSRHTAKQYEIFYQLNKEITVLHNMVPVDSKNLNRDADNSVIVFVGSLSPFKGIRSLLKAWNIVHKKHPQAILQLFGKGKPKDFMSLLDDQARTSVVVTGFADANTIHRAFSNATAAVFPSYTECFSLTPLEAMSLGCPVIFTERASGPELINDGENGLLVDPDNIHMIAESIVRLLAEKDLRDRVSKNGKETILVRFNIKDSAFAHLNFYQTVIENHRQDTK